MERGRLSSGGACYAGSANDPLHSSRPPHYAWGMAWDGHDASRPLRVAVIGGGLTGLAAAHRLGELSDAGRPVEVTVLEASDRAGGIIGTTLRDGYVIEKGPDNFVTNKPWGMALVKRLGMEDRIQRIDERHRRALILHRGKLRSIPEGFLLMAPTKWWPFVTMPIVSWPGKLRMAREWFMGAAKHEDPNWDESLESFAVRRFGREAFERIVQPLVGGIYAADPAKLSVRATLPHFLDMETEHGSVIKAMRRQVNEKAKQNPRGQRMNDTGVRYSIFVTFKQGMGELIDKLVQTIRDRQGPNGVRLSTAVESIQHAPNDRSPWRLSLRTGELLAVDRVVLATAAHPAAGLLGELAPEAATNLRAIEHGSAAVIYFAFRRDQISHPLDAAGFVVPHVEGRDILAGTFCSSKYEGRAPQGHVLLRAFVGGALNATILDHDDIALTAIAQRELGELLGIKGEPLFTHVSRYPHAMPQYTLGHLDRVRRIRDAMADLPGLALAGNAFTGVGIPDCIHAGEIAAEQVAKPQAVQTVTAKDEETTGPAMTGPATAG